MKIYPSLLGGTVVWGLGIGFYNLTVGYARRELTQPLTIPWAGLLFSNVLVIGLTNPWYPAWWRPLMMAYGFGVQAVPNLYPRYRMFTLYPDEEHPANRPLFPPDSPRTVYNYHPNRYDRLEHLQAPPTGRAPVWPTLIVDDDGNQVASVDELKRRRAEKRSQAAKGTTPPVASGSEVVGRPA